MSKAARSTIADRVPSATELGVLIACAVLLTGFTFVGDRDAYQPPPNFAAMEVEEKKRQFFAYLSPMVSEVNFQLAAERDRVRDLKAARESGESIAWADRRWLRRLATRLEVDLDSMPLDEALTILERRAGVVPESLVLVQAAVESGWGSSRFASEGNNYFGQRCYREDCGMIPEDRAEGAIFGLAEYESPAESVESYILNLNTHEEYRDFRELRQDRRDSGQPITGLALVEELGAYSERGTEYVDQIASMIRANDLE